MANSETVAAIMAFTPALIRALGVASGGSVSSLTFTDALILGAATTSGVRLDLESGNLAVREGDDSGYGPIVKAGQYYCMSGATTLAAMVQSAQVVLGAAVGLRWYSDSDILAGGSNDTGLKRSSAGVVQVTDGSSGMGSLRALRTATARTGDATLAATDSLSFQTNEGASGAVNLTLPTAVAGYSMGLIVQANQYIRFTAATGDTIRDGSTVSAAAGYIRSTTVGSTLIIQSINATEWIVVSKTGTWTVDS